MKKNSDVIGVFKFYKAAVEEEIGRRIKVLQSDNGEFSSNRSTDFHKKGGIQRQFHAPHTPSGMEKPREEIKR